jgi:simple sugar transport system substrate-binding protein
MNQPRRRRALAGLAAVLALVLSACSAQGGKKSETGGQVAGTERYTIAMITHEHPGDSFWDKIRTGAKAAAAKDNIELRYQNNAEAAGQANLIQNAIDQKVDAIAVTLSKPEPLAPAIRAAVDAGIPVVAFNSGIKEWQRLGALQYFGSDEDLAGEAVGKRLAGAGAKRALCVVHEQGSVSLEARCAGVKSSFPNVENLNVNGTDLTSVRSTIGAKLQQDRAVDYIVTLGAPFALAALQSATDAGSKAEVVTFDLNAEAAKAIKDGTIEFSVDQQPYLQGYEAIDSLWLYLTNGNELGGGLPVLTGPSFVDRTNIDEILTYANNNTR